MGCVESRALDIDDVGGCNLEVKASKRKRCFCRRYHGKKVVDDCVSMGSGTDEHLPVRYCKTSKEERGMMKKLKGHAAANLKKTNSSISHRPKDPPAIKVFRSGSVTNQGYALASAVLPRAKSHSFSRDLRGDEMDPGLQPGTSGHLAGASSSARSTPPMLSKHLHTDEKNEHQRDASPQPITSSISQASSSPGINTLHTRSDDSPTLVTGTGASVHFDAPKKGSPNVNGNNNNDDNNTNNQQSLFSRSQHNLNADIDEMIARIVRAFPFPGTPRASPRLTPKRPHCSSSKRRANNNNNMQGRSQFSRMLSSSPQVELYGQLRKKNENATGGVIGDLVLGSFDLTAPAVCISEWLKERLKNFTQICGHEGTIVPATEKTLWKKRVANDSNEATAYTKLMQDIVWPLVPKYYNEVEYKCEYFIEIEDLCHHFENPAIMDVKVGTRTFLESEVTNPVKRSDLYQKMIKVDVSEPTDEEHAERAITKLRYMQFRERESSTASLGFRIEAINMPGQVLEKDFKKVKDRGQVLELMANFLQNRKGVRAKLVERLILMREKIEESPLFATHEVIGSSILIIYDKCRVGAWMIDFAKVLPVPDGIILDHRKPWKIGNHEDGYLLGMDYLIQVVQDTEFMDPACGGCNDIYQASPKGTSTSEL